MSESQELRLVPPPTDEDKRREQREKNAAYARAYRASHPDTPEQRAKKALYHAARYASNKERVKARSAAWAKAHPERMKAYYRKANKNPKRKAVVKAWLARNPGKIDEYRRRREYGLEPAAFDALLQVQNGCCAICRTHFGTRTPHVDHVHDETKRIRGLLCKQCNLGIGYFHDSPEALAAAIAYLRPKETP